MRPILLLTLCAAVVSAAEQATPSQTYTGTFSWTGKPKAQDLRCTLTPGEGGVINAAFVAQWQGKPHNYAAVLTPDAETKVLSGPATVKKADDYRVQGSVTEGVFSAEFFTADKNGQEKSAGTFTVRLEQAKQP